MLAVGGASSSPGARVVAAAPLAVNNGLVSGFARKNSKWSAPCVSSRPFERSRDAVSAARVCKSSAHRHVADGRSASYSVHSPASANTVPLTALAVAITNTGPFPLTPLALRRSRTAFTASAIPHAPLRPPSSSQLATTSAPLVAHASASNLLPSTPDARARAVTSAPSRARDSPYRFTASTTASTMSRPTSSNRNAPPLDSTSSVSANLYSRGSCTRISSDARDLDDHLDHRPRHFAPRISGRDATRCRRTA